MSYPAASEKGVPTDLCVVTSYFNPTAYQTKLVNYETFARGLREVGVPLFTIELAFGDAPFELPSGDATLHLRGGGVLWQKERLLNLLIRTLPQRFTKIAWVDADLLFERPDWALQTSYALDEITVLQPFSQVVRLPRGAKDFLAGGEEHASVGASLALDPECLTRRRWESHGHTGFAWAARRSLLEVVGLYDVCPVGGADHLMTHAFCDDARSRCIDHIVGRESMFRRHFEDWSDRIAPEMKGEIGYIEGRVLHLWHGDTIDRNYYERYIEVLRHGFNPVRDLTLNPQGLWQWSHPSGVLQELSRNYFESRWEDGRSGPSTLLLG